MSASQPPSSANFEIDFADEQSTLEIDFDFLRECSTELLQAEGVAAAELSVAFVDHSRMHELNWQFLQHDETTDVLSFRLDEGPMTEEEPLEGQLIICAEMARDRASDFDWTAREELVLYLVHGLLHLVGYDDLTPEERGKMRTKEREHLARWGFSPQYAEDRQGNVPATSAQQSPADSLSDDSVDSSIKE